MADHGAVALVARDERGTGRSWLLLLDVEQRLHLGVLALFHQQTAELVLADGAREHTVRRVAQHPLVKTVT